MTHPIDSTTTTGAKWTLLIQLLEDSGIPTNKSKALANELICKFKWIARSLSMYFDTSCVLTAYEERDEKLTTNLEKKQYNQFIALHPNLPEFVNFVVLDKGLIDDLGKVIDHHISEAKNSNTNTLWHLITKLLPENPNRDVIDPLLTGKSKSEQGFNHKMMGALLCPLSLCAEYDQDPGTFNDKVNTGEITINLDDYPSSFYPPKTPYNEDFIEEKFFQGYSFIRLVFALTDIENWAIAHHSGLKFTKFHADMVRMSADPEDEWGTETLDYLTRKAVIAKRKQPVEDEDSEGQKESAMTKSLKNRQARRAQRAAAEQEQQSCPEQRAEPHPPTAPAVPASEAHSTVPSIPPAPLLTRCPNNIDEEDNEPPQLRRQTQCHVLCSPLRSLTPEVEQPPPSSSPAPHSSPPPPPPGLMGPPPPPCYPHTLWELTNNLRNS